MKIPIVTQKMKVMPMNPTKKKKKGKARSKRNLRPTGRLLRKRGELKEKPEELVKNLRRMVLSRGLLVQQKIRQEMP